VKNVTWIPALLILFALGSIGIVACDSQGPAEEAGENIDETAEDVGDYYDDTTDDLEDRYEDTFEDDE